MTKEQLNQTDAFARTNGIRIIGISAKWATTEMVVCAGHLNGAGVCQGGALFTLADLSQAALTHGHALTVDAHMQFVAPAHEGDRLLASSHLEHDGRMPLVVTRITDQDARLIAILSARLCKMA